MSFTDIRMSEGHRRNFGSPIHCGDIAGCSSVSIPPSRFEPLSRSRLRHSSRRRLWEALRERVLPRASRFDEDRADFHLVEPVLSVPGDELRTILTPDVAACSELQANPFLHHTLHHHKKNGRPLRVDHSVMFCWRPWPLESR